MLILLEQWTINRTNKKAIYWLNCLQGKLWQQSKAVKLIKKKFWMWFSSIFWKVAERTSIAAFFLLDWTMETNFVCLQLICNMVITSPEIEFSALFIFSIYFTLHVCFTFLPVTCVFLEVYLLLKKTFFFQFSVSFHLNLIFWFFSVHLNFLFLFITFQFSVSFHHISIFCFFFVHSFFFILLLSFKLQI